MLKNISKRLLALLMVLAMIVPMIPLAGIHVRAENGPTLSVDGLTLTTSGSATWTGSGTSINGNVAGTDKSGCTAAATKNGTLAFTNLLDSGNAAYLTFDYNITSNNGSVTIGGETLTGSGSHSVLVEYSLSVSLVITSGEGSLLTTTIDLTNIALTEVSSTEVTFKAPENGSYTLDGAVIAEDITKTVTPPVTYDVVANPATGYKFAGWYSTAANGYVAYTETAKITVTGADTIYPVFISSTTPVFKVGSNIYIDLNDANAAAKNTSDKLIVLIQSGTLVAGTYEISAGVKLLIPHNDAYTADFDETPGIVNNAKDTANNVWVKPSMFRNLTLADGAVVNCYGQINVNSQMYVCTNVRTSITTGPYGVIDITSGGKLVMESGSKLYAYGYIGGEGTVEGKSGSAIYQMMQICDWRGGSATSDLSGNMKGNSFLFSQYYLQNIEALLKVNSGSTMYAVTGLTAGSGILNQMKQVSAPIIGTDKGLFRFNADRVDDYMTLKYEPTTDRMKVELYGQISTVSIDMAVNLGIGMNFSLNTDEYILPIPMNFTINVKSGSTVSFTEKFKLLPGTEIIVEEGASVTVGQNGAVYLYDVDDWNSGKYAHLQTIYQLNYVHAQKGAPVKRTPNKDSVLRIDGTLNAMGPIYSTNYTENGGNACITGNGTVTIGAHGTLSLKEVNSNNTDDIKIITCVPILGKVVGHEGNVSLDIGTYKSINGQWYQYTMTVDSVTVESGALQDGDVIYVGNAKDTPAKVIVTAAQPCVKATNASVTKNLDGTFTITNITNNTVVTAGEHTLKDLAAVAPDCVNPGQTAGKICEVCGEYTTPTTEIPAHGHTEVIDKAVSPTCTTTGLTEGKHCSVCDVILVEQTVVPTLGHTHETISGKASTCTETGLTEGTKCSVCGEILVKQEVINALGHDYSYVVEGTYKAPTCTEDGKESDMKCVRCGSVISGATIEKTGHNHSIVVEGSAKAPTCIEDGKEVDLKCANCDDVKTGVSISATGHDEVIDKAVTPTCTTTGLTEGSHCATCGEVIIAQEVVDALGHDYVSVVTAPTCEDKGYTTHTCSRCGDSYVDSYTDPIASNHNYNSTVNVSPTCIDEGYEARACSICGHKEKIEGSEKPAYGHEFSFGVLTPTCTEGGYTVRTCGICDYSDIVDYTDALGHDCVATVTHPTCTEQGYTTHNCSRCGYTHIPADSYKPAYGHQYEQSMFVATCTEGGYTEFECMDCGHVYIPEESRTEALGHCYYKDYIEIIVTKPTCTAQGYTTHNCYCGEHSHGLDYVPATGHSYGEWGVTKPATCTVPGERTKTCAGCGDVITETVPATGHNHITTVTAPTCTEKGYTTFTCVCGDTYVGNYVDAKGHIEVITHAVDPTCKNEGRTEGKHCSVCNEVLVESQTIAKLAHTFGAWTTSKVPSCTAEGEEARMCAVCGTSETRPLAKTAHVVVIDPAVPARYDKIGLTEGSHCSACNEVLVAQEEVDKLVLNWETFKQGLEALEYYASIYAKSNPGKDPMKLMINFLRTGVDRYTDDSWETMAGAPETSFIKDVLAYDDIYGTHAYALREMDGLEITMPNGEKMEFDHLFGAMNVSSKNNYGVNNTDFGSWVGDLCDLMLFVWEGETFKGGYNEDNYTLNGLIELINDEYFGVDANSAFQGSFGLADVRADLDVFYFVDKIKDGETSLLKIYKELYTEKLTDEVRAAYFLNNRFPGSMTNEAVRASIFNTYKDNFLVQVLESSREVSGYPKLREACAYAFADYLFEKADGLLVEPEEDKPDEGEEEEKKIYQIFNSSSSTLAPGVNQTVNYAVNSKGEQIVFFTSTADLRRDDVKVFANYANNDPSKGWAMAPVSAQMAAAIQNNKNVQNYNPVVGVNANFYNMSTGEPSGLFVMNSTVYKEGGNAFFAVLKDGTAVIGSASDYSQYKGNIAEAVGGSTLLVKDGVSLYPNPDNSYAPRTAVGLTADGKVVVMVIDGRQSPYSAGANFNEIAQIMIDAGCVSAINLDGGGSSTFVSKAEGSDNLSVLNRPCDSVERSVSSSLMIVSTAPTSREFHHAVVNTPTDYITIGSSFNIGLIGVGEAGNTADIPAGAYLQVSDASKGSIKGNTFTALAVGKVEIQLAVNGNVVGTKAVNVIRRPTALAFREANLNAIYGVAEDLPLIATYNNTPVTINHADILFEMSNSSAGVMDGFAFIGTESSKVRNVTIVAKVAGDTTITASMGLRLYSADESIFDFDGADAGNESLAWNRDIVNTFTIDNKTYFTVDPTKDVYANYVFALDMKAITAPVRLQPLMEYLNGFAEGVGDNAGPWDYLLALGGRVSGLTTVTVNVTFPKGVYIDINDITFVQDFMNIKSSTYDEDTNTLTMVLSWIRQTAGIDASTANSIAIISGIKLIPNGVGDISISGNVTYDIYLDTSQLHSFAKDPANQQKYGIYDYINPDDPEDAGGHFADTYINFEDNFSIKEESLNGWVTGGVDNDLYYYYINNEMVTGIVLVPDREGSGKSYYYDFGDNGICKGIYTGLFYDEIASGYKFARFGELQTGWVDHNDNVYYFDPTTYLAKTNGVHKIDYFKQTFDENGVLIKGHLVRIIFNGEYHTRYMFGGKYQANKFVEIDGKTYWFDKNGLLVTGPQVIQIGYGYRPALYDIDENGVVNGFMDYTGPYVCNGVLYGFVNGYITEVGFLECEQGIYYCDNTKGMLVTGKMYIVESDATESITKGWHYFDENGKLYHNEFAEIDGARYYMVYGVPVKGAFEYNGNVYYANWNGVIQTGKCEVTEKYTNGVIEAGDYFFGADGTFCENGFVVDNGKTYYVIDGKIGYTGVFEVDGGIYYAEWNGVIQTGKYYVMAENGNGIVGAGYYYADENGRMYDGEFVEIDGKRVYIEKGQIKRGNGVCVLNGDLYCCEWNGTAMSGKIYIVEEITNGLVNAGWFYTDDNGRFLNNEFATIDGHIYYMVKGQPTKQHGITEINGERYCFEWNGALMVGKPYVVGEITNGFGNAGWYYTDVNGRFLNKEFATIDGKVYYMLNGQPAKYHGVTEIDGDLYCFEWNGTLMKGKFFIVSEITNGFGNTGWNYTDENGRLYSNEFKTIDGNVYYMMNGQPAKYTGVTEIDGELYCFEWNGVLRKGKIYIVPEVTNGIVESGWFYTDGNGKFYNNEFLVIDGNTYYMLKGQTMKRQGIFEINGELYCFEWNGVLRTGKIYVDANGTNGYIEIGWAYTDENGRLYNNEFLVIDGKTYYMINGQIAKIGVFEIDGELYYADTWNGVIYANGRYYVSPEASNGLIIWGFHDFDANGKMLN